MEKILNRYQAFLLDAYGVFWGSSAVGMLPGAKEAMAYLVSHGKQVGILSNTTQLVAKEKAKLAKHGVEEGVHYHFLLTSGQVTCELLRAEQLPFPTPKKTYWLLGEDHPRFSPHSVLFEGSPYTRVATLEEADFIYIGIPHIDGVDQETPEGFDVKEIAQKGRPILCSNPDHFAHEGTPPRLVMRQGMIAHLLQQEGASVHFIGKPFSTVYQKALERFSPSINPKDILMIGDTPETDIRGARQMGLATALVIETGVMSERSLNMQKLPVSDQPNHQLTRFDIHEL